MAFLLKWMWGILSALGLYNKKAKIVFLGLDNAGKTTLMHMLRDGKVLEHEPTQRPGHAELAIGSITFQTHDMGGHKAARRLWKDYLVNVGGIVFMVDAADKSRFEEAKKELDKLLTDDDLKKVPFCVLGNKIDKKEASGEDDVKSALGLEGLCTGKKGTALTNGQQPLELFMCSVVKKSGYQDGFKWLSNYL